MSTLSTRNVNQVQRLRRIGINSLYYRLGVHGLQSGLFLVRIDGVEQSTPASIRMIGDLLNERGLSKIEIRALEDDGTMVPESPWIEVFFDRWQERLVNVFFVGLGLFFVTAAILVEFLAANHFGGGTLAKMATGLVCSVIFTLLLIGLLIAGIIQAYETRENLKTWLTKRRRSRYFKAARNVSEDVKRAIEAGDILIGMTKEQVHAAIGPPKRIEVKSVETADLTLWEYQNLFIKVSNDLRRYDYVYFEGSMVRSAHWSGGGIGHLPRCLPRLPEEASKLRS